MIRRHKILKMVIFPKLIYRLNTILIIIPDGFLVAVVFICLFGKHWQVHPKIHVEIKRTQHRCCPKKIEKKSKFERFTFSNFKTYVKY